MKKLTLFIILLSTAITFAGENIKYEDKDNSYSSYYTTQTEKKREYNSYGNCPNGSYVNSYGNTVCSPSSSNAGGATAVCKDGTYSYSQNRRGTCSRHGGVARWLR